MANSENLQFKAEIQQLLSLMIHSIYSNKDIFLRELIANAADAIDKARFLSLTNPDLVRDWEIRISSDPAAKTLTVADNGVGMDRDELVQNLGTIAHSGTKAFMEAVRKAKEADNKGTDTLDLIGQFGVGFYSAFMAADKVVVETRKAGADKAYRWESDGKESFTITECDLSEIGTRVTLFVKDEYTEYLDYWKISSIVKKYSDFIEYPIRMKHTVKDKDGKDIEEDSTMNSMKAIWLRPESEVTEEEFNHFYTYLTQDYGKPTKRISFNAEGASEFKSLLFLAAHMPFNFQFGMKNKKNLHLYVKRVFITDDCPGLLPEYMGFVSGVVDSSDLPLNISREMLQDNPQIARICKSLTKRVLSELAKMLANERSAYETFYKEFGRMIKEGVHMDYSNREKLQDLLLFESMNHPGKLITLKEYSDAMPATQKEIYYLSGDTREALENSPQLEMLKKQNFDVLFLLDPVDEFVLSDIGKYADREIKSVASGEVKFDESIQKDLEEKAKKAAEDNKSLVDFLKKALENKVKDVRFSSRLTESPCCLVSDKFDPSVNMQKILKAMDKNAPDYKRILELNADNPLIQAMKTLHDKNPEDPKLSEYAELLYDQAIISEGGLVSDPVVFAKRTIELMTNSIQKDIGA